MSFFKKFSSKNAPKRVSPPSYSQNTSSSSTVAPTQRKRGGNLCGFTYQSAAILASFLTMANGGWSFIDGLQWTTSGGSLMPFLDFLEILIGVGMVLSASVMLVVMYSRLKDMRIMVAIVGFFVAFIGPIALIGLSVFVGLENKSVDLLSVITDNCDQENTAQTDPFTDVSVQELQQACIQDNTDYFNHLLLWTALRAVFQVFMGFIIALWTFWRVVELRSIKPRNRAMVDPFSDPQSIPFTDRLTTPPGKGEVSHVSVYGSEGGIVYGDAPPYNEPITTYAPPKLPPMQ